MTAGGEANPNENQASTSTVMQMQSAMNMADLIRKHLDNDDGKQHEGFQFASWAKIPGMKEGAGAGVAVLAVMVPLGSVLQVRKNPASLAMYTIAQITLSLNAAMYVGILSGSYNWLNRLATFSPTKPSASASRVCHDDRILAAVKQIDSDRELEPLSLNPHKIILHEFQKVLRHCQKRNLHEQQIAEEEEQLQLSISQEAQESNSTATKSWWYR
mmetsp:Transcript_11524/g.25680  ORF Transcript_11524/g.25680 Transcript_11524/m.25680 type:complete len:215 (-) Transcript_11524:52-696(-)